jgi:hypothetical protein
LLSKLSAALPNLSSRRFCFARSCRAKIAHPQNIATAMPTPAMMNVDVMPGIVVDRKSGGPAFGSTHWKIIAEPLG